MKERHTKWTNEHKTKFLEKLALTGNVTEAARLIGSSRERAYELRRLDKKFAKAWNAALKESADVLEAEAYRRAVEGVDEPVFFQGMECGLIRKYSDSLLTLLLKHAKRKKYMDRSEVAVDAKVKLTKVRAEEMTDDELAAIAAGRSIEGE